jgi:hypothetical protein
MKLYVISISEAGGLVASTEKPQVSKLGLRRKAGQRYQVPSVARHVTEELKNPELEDAVALFMQDIKAELDANGFCEINWAVTTEDPVVIYNRETGEKIEINRKWADWDMEQLDKILIHYMGAVETEAEPDAQQAGNNNGNGNANPNATKGAAGRPRF